MTRTLGRQRSAFRLIVIGAGIVTALIFHPSDAAAQWIGVASAWSAPGSTGVADEASLPLVTFDHAKASVRPTAPAGSLVWLRFPVFASATYVDSIPIWPYNFYGYYTEATLTMSFQRNEEAALLFALLRRVRLSDGETSLVMTVDGNMAIPSPAVQTVTKTISCDGFCMQLDQYAYWVEVALWKVKATSDPKVVAVGVRLH
jgi:hypothetical protein